MRQQETQQHQQQSVAAQKAESDELEPTGRQPTQSKRLGEASRGASSKTIGLAGQQEPKRRTGAPTSSSPSNSATIRSNGKRKSSTSNGLNIDPSPEQHRQSCSSSLVGPQQDKTAQIVCAACSKPIRERYLLEALDKQWHEDCLKCACCDCRLGEVGSSLFTQADKILCRRDFLRIFGQPGSCAACKKSIPPYELVMRANDNAYHMECFACQQCQYRFCVGDRFHLTDLHRIVCTLCHGEQSSLATEPHHSHLSHLNHNHNHSHPLLRPHQPQAQPQQSLQISTSDEPTSTAIT